MAARDDEYVKVPKSVIDWLLGEGPDSAGKWFDESAEIEGARGRYWWRSSLQRAMASQQLKEAPMLRIEHNE